MIKKVMVFGTFDKVHEGHRFLFREAKKYGNYLITVVARDTTVLSVKGRPPLYNEQERLGEVKRETSVDVAILGNVDDRYRVVREYSPDVICLGYDQRITDKELKEKLDALDLQKTAVVRLRAYKPEIYKSSFINTRK